MSQVILERGSLKVEAYGDESDNIFRNGSRVAIPERLAKKLNKNRDRLQAELAAERNQHVRQGDSFERIYESTTTMRYGGIYDSTSMADFFPIDRSCGWASAIRMNLEVSQAPRMASVICCATDVPTLAVSRDRKRVYSGFLNLGVATDTCIFDELSQAEADQNGGDGSGESINMDAEYLEEVNMALTEASNYVALNGHASSNVLGLKNNPYINTVLIEPVSVVNPIISFRKLTMFLETRNKTIISLDGLFTKTYTLMLPVSLVTALASTYVTLGDYQMSSLAILTGAGGSLPNDPSIPKFRIVGLSPQILEPWHDGTTDIAYLFTAGSSSLADGLKWYKPFSMLNLGENIRHGLRSFNFFGARVGGIEMTSPDTMLRVLIPQA